MFFVYAMHYSLFLKLFSNNSGRCCFVIVHVYLTFAETGTEGPTSSHTTSPPNGIKTAVFAYLRDIDLFVLFSHLLANKKIRI